MQTLRIYDEQIYAISDMLSYYAMCDYGCGEQRPLSPEQEDHVRMIKEFQEQVDLRAAKLEVLQRTQDAEEVRG